MAASSRQSVSDSGDLMVDHDWQQRWGVTLQDTTLVRQIEVDYLRVYQQK